MRMRPLALTAVCLLVAKSLGAQESPPPASRLPPPGKPIQDNSFLLEEAYNQERAVIQHISSVLFDRSISTWLYSLTDEWPLGGQRHQLSVTVPVLSSTSGTAAALGDI